jgi:hypothetical protein
MKGNHRARLLTKKWTKPAYRIVEERRLHMSFSATTIRYESLAPIQIYISALGPIIGFASRGLTFHPNLPANTIMLAM